MKPYYKILKVYERATQEDIKLSYRVMSKQYHPDKNQGDKDCEEKFKKINEAYSVLSDPEKRKQYDKVGLIEQTNIDDVVKEHLIKVFKYALELCIYETDRRDVLFTKVYESVSSAKTNKENELEIAKMNIKDQKSNLKKISGLKSKNKGELFQESIKRIKDQINEKIDEYQNDISRLNLEIKVKNKMLKILKKDYPKEPEEEKPNYSNFDHRSFLKSDLFISRT